MRRHIKQKADLEAVAGIALLVIILLTYLLTHLK
jgi:hypothetical protein